MNASAGVEIFCCVVLLIVTAVHAVVRLRKPRELWLVDLAIWFVGLMVGFGPIIAVASGAMLPDVATDALIETYLAVALYMIGLYVTGLGRRRSRHTPAAAAQGIPTDGGGAAATLGNGVFALVFRSHNASLIGVVLAATFALLIKVWFGLTYGVFFSGDMLSQMNFAPYWASSLNYFATTFPYPCLIWASVHLFTPGKKRLLLASTILTIPLILAFLQGRRWLVSSFALLILVSFLMRGIRTRFIVLTAVLALALGYVVLPFFYMVRINRSSYSDRGNAVETVMRAVSDTLANWDEDTGKQLYQRNLQGRTLFLRFVTSVVEAQHDYPWMYGKALRGSFYGLIPGIWAPDKLTIDYDKHSILRHYGLQITDTMASWFLYGVADFGLVGAMAYGVLVGLLLRWFQALALWLSTQFPFIALCITGAIFDSISCVEDTPLNLLGCLRNLLMLASLFIVLRCLSGKKHAELMDLRANEQAALAYEQGRVAYGGHAPA